MHHTSEGPREHWLGSPLDLKLPKVKLQSKECKSDQVIGTFTLSQLELFNFSSRYSTLYSQEGVLVPHPVSGPNGMVSVLAR